MKLSIIVPVYNEYHTVGIVINNLLSLEIDKEIIIIDDGSDDSSMDVIEAISHPEVRYLRHSKRLGKGAAIKSAIEYIRGDITIIQDADLEYDTSDIVSLVSIIQSSQADVVYGVRDLSSQKSIVRMGNVFLTWIANKIYNKSIRDLTTCYKVMRSDVFRQLMLNSNDFSIEAEITAKLFRLNKNIKEYSINYSPRYKNKKLTILDGVPMLLALIKYRKWHPELECSKPKKNCFRQMKDM